MNNKILTKHNLQIGNVLEIGIDKCGEIAESIDERDITIKARVVGATSYDCILKIEPDDFKKYKKKINCCEDGVYYNDTNCLSEDLTSKEINQDGFIAMGLSKYNYNKLGDPAPQSPIESKFGVKIGDKIKVYFTKQNRLCSKTKSKTGKLVEGTVVGGNESRLIVHFDDDTIKDNNIKGLTYTYSDDLGAKYKDDESLGAIGNSSSTKYNFHSIYNSLAFQKVVVEEEKVKELYAEEPETAKDVKTDINEEGKKVKETEQPYKAELGDKVLVERDKTGRLAEGNSIVADTSGKFPPLVATLVSFSNQTVLLDDKNTTAGATASSYKGYVEEPFLELMTDDARAWNTYGYTLKPVKALGLKVGDEVLVGYDSQGYLFQNDNDAKRWKGKKGVKAKVIGFEFKDGQAIAPLLYIDRAELKRKKEGKFNSSHKKDIFPRFLKDKSIDQETGCFWYVYGDKVFKKLERNEGDKMSNENVKPEFWDMIKANGESALYRVAAQQGTKGIKAAILSVMSKQGSGSDRIKALEDLLETQFGDALVSMILGLSLTYMPKISEDPRVNKLATELRINSMGTVGNAAMDMAMEFIAPAVMGALSTLDDHQVRIAEKRDESEHEEEKQEEKKTMTA